MRAAILIALTVLCWFGVQAQGSRFQYLCARDLVNRKQTQEAAAAWREAYRRHPGQVPEPRWGNADGGKRNPPRD